MIARATPLLILLAMLPAVLLAGDAKPAEPYVLKNRSTFTAVSDEQRAPFWPIGWTKRKSVSITSTVVQPVAEPIRAAFDAASVKVTSILLGSPSLAIINGRSYSEGDYLRQPKGAAAAAPTARVRIYRINDGNVIIERNTERVVVALQRPELVQRGPGEELLTEDRP